MTPDESTKPKLCPSESTHTYISRLIMDMKNCLAVLKASPTTDQLEEWATLIHESMSLSSRNFHSVKHVFDLAQNQDDPILVLSAFFHDCIYYHVDGGFSKPQKTVLKNVLVMKGTDLYLEESTSKQTDFLLRMVESIFGFPPGKKVDHMSGLNEFLSAVVAVRKLQSVLDHSILAQIACCIEATIPFRPDDPMERLYERMVTTNEEYDLNMNEATLIESVQRAVRLSNLDVANFATTDRAWFLSNTWSLLPETNQSLRHQYLYTVSDFQFAVYKLYGFFSSVKAETVFTSFRGVPPVNDLKRMTTEATRNMEIGLKYVRAKLLSTSLLLAFATLTGGDAPMSLLMGDLPTRQHQSRRLEDALPTPPPANLAKCDMDVYEILLNGRSQETYFDIRQSPLAAYLYGWMGDDAVTQVMQDRQVYPMDEQRARDLLSELPRRILDRVAENMAHVAVSRADAIRAVVEGLPNKSNDDGSHLNGA